MKIIAVIVTYNRLALLKKCLQAVQNQTLAPDEIIVVNNGSTDDTEEWLAGEAVSVFRQENNGGAGGFSQGIRLACAQGADWVWLMDDDTIPRFDALEELVAMLGTLGDDQDQTGFLSSKVLWTDGSLHEMNRTYLLKKRKTAARGSLPLVQFGTFVSMLVSAGAIQKVGLPIKEYFIWNDDVEYAKRMIASGYAGIAAEKSIAVHETPLNHLSSVFKDTHTHLWKYHYGMRNELFTKRLHEGTLQFWVTWLHRMLILPFRIAIHRSGHRWPFIKMIWQTSLAALSFKPTIEFLPEEE